MSSPGSPVSETALSGSLSVYAEKGYQTALERVFRTLNLRHPLLDMQWADTPAGADIVITDRLPAEEPANTARWTMWRIPSATY